MTKENSLALLAGWAGIAIFMLAGIYLGVASVREAEIPTTRIWVERQATLPVAAEIPLSPAQYDLPAIRSGAMAVPRLLLADLPMRLPEIGDTAHRKRLFIKTMLPPILHVNELLEQDRRRIQMLKARHEAGLPLSAPDVRWLATLAQEYRLSQPDFDKLLQRVDIIPPSLALAQAAIESGWGTSRFAQLGNALFGQWTWDGPGIAPRKRAPGKRHKVRRFDTPLGSVYAYTRNLNTHRTYREFRRMRAEFRAAGRQPQGYALASTLSRYSQRGSIYVDELHLIIRANRLGQFDNAILAKRPIMARRTRLAADTSS